MTREEAIKRLKSDIYEYADFTENPNENEFWTAFDMAIEALERMEPPDCESVTHEERMEDEEVITLHKGALKAVTGRFVVYDREWLKEHFNTTEAYLYGGIRASDVPDTNAGDLISRQEVLDEINRIGNGAFTEYAYYSNLFDFVCDLPSVEPERKTGKWVHMVGWWECDQCNAEYTDMPTCMGKAIYEYCPMCGSYNGGGNNGNE